MLYRYALSTEIATFALICIIFSWQQEVLVQREIKSYDTCNKFGWREHPPLERCDRSSRHGATANRPES